MAQRVNQPRKLPGWVADALVGIKCCTLNPLSASWPLWGWISPFPAVCAGCLLLPSCRRGVQTPQKGDAQPNMSFTGLSYLGAGELLPLSIAVAVSVSDSVTIVLNLEDRKLQFSFCLLCLAALFSPTILVQSLQCYLPEVNDSAQSPVPPAGLWAVVNYSASVGRLLGEGNGRDELQEKMFSIKYVER